MLVGALIAFLLYLLHRKQGHLVQVEAELQRAKLAATFKEATARTESQRTAAREARARYEKLLKSYKKSIIAERAGHS